MRKLKILWSASGRTKRLLIEAYFYLAWARIIKRKPFSKISILLGEEMKETPVEIDDKYKKNLSEISQVIRMMSNYTFWESECLVKAIAAMKMLEKRKIESTLYLGTAKGEAGDFIAHAWLRSGPYYITGAEEKEQFTVVHKFAKRMERGGAT